VQKLRLGLRALAIFEPEDYEKKQTGYQDGELIGMLYEGRRDSISDSTIERIKAKLDEHDVAYEILNPNEILVRNKNRVDINRVDRLIKVNHAQSILSPGIEANYQIAMSKGENLFKINENSSKENIIVPFDGCVCGREAKVYTPRNKKEIVRILAFSTPTKEQTKEKVGEINVTCEQKTFLIVNPATFTNHIWCSVEHKSLQIHLTKGAYNVMKIRNSDGNVVGLTIQRS
jgi:hypothetical protein